MEEEQMSSPIASGLYHIRSKVDAQSIGRHAQEDKSLNPKRIVLLDSSEAEGPNAIWEVQQKDGGGYILKCRGAVSAAKDFHLWAILHDSDEGTIWRITKQQRGGYTIEDTKGLGAISGWVIPTFDTHQEDQIAVRPLIVLPTYPPTYPDAELFLFEQIKE
ncbi:hypothetical protein TWF281_006169 [Arthrobotrys megalospora]